MFRVIRTLGLRELVAGEAVPFVVSLALAETLYKFHSFTLEALAFLATWYLLGGASEIARSWLGPRGGRPTGRGDA
jgi:hypothetical protein